MAGVFWPLPGILAGAFVATQAPINAEVGRGPGLPVAATAASVLSGAIILALVTAAVSQYQDTTIAWGAPPLWLFVTGAAFVTAGILLLRLGAAATMASIVSGQLIAGMLLDRIGFLGMKVREITLGCVTGAMLLLVGARLIRFY